MLDVPYPVRVGVICDVITRAREVGSYQAADWLESHLRYLEIQENERSDERVSGKDDDSP